ncbi:MAG: copper-containing nitrite reductase [Ignavibacteria bacterium]|nr:copper-containing nitrite reductase [Ignavibacteria bacterium]
MKLKNTYYPMLAGITILFAISFLTYPFYGCSDSYSTEVSGEEVAVLTHAPYVPSPITRNHPTKVIVHLETSEVVRELSEGVEYTFWTFGGEVPGKFIRVKEGDLVEFHLHNHQSSKMPHNIDLHAVTGPGGGAASSFTAPGYSSVFSFKAINSGLYVYHCATAPVGLHIANGMYGLILVEPKEGLPKVDREYYVMQSEFYTDGDFGVSGLQPFNQQKAVDERPSYVVFNGSTGSLVGEKAIQAKVGEKIRLFIGNGGPNLISSFHVIGEIFDNVYGEGGTKINQNNVQTTLVPAGGSSIVEFKVDVPGTLILVDHSIFRAFNKGAIGMLKVSGDEDLEIYSGKQREEVYLGSTNNNDPGLLKATLQSGASTAENSNKKMSKEELMAMGKNLYTATCQACHQVDGKGLPNVFPPLAQSDYLKDKSKTIKTVLKGLSGEVIVNGKKYNNIMPPQNFDDIQTAAVLTYVYNNFGNSGGIISKEEVAKNRK